MYVMSWLSAMLQGEDCRCNVRPRGSAAAEGASLMTMSWLVLLLAWIMSQGELQAYYYT